MILRTSDNPIIFKPVCPDDFIFRSSQSEHLKIEKALEEIGGEQWKGFKFKNEILFKCGWNRDVYSNYSANPTVAAKAFNRIRFALALTSNKNKLEKLADEFALRNQALHN